MFAKSVSGTLYVNFEYPVPAASRRNGVEEIPPFGVKPLGLSS
jgi:hypothetical protein